MTATCSSALQFAELRETKQKLAKAIECLRATEGWLVCAAISTPEDFTLGSVSMLEQVHDTLIEVGSEHPALQSSQPPRAEDDRGKA